MPNLLAQPIFRQQQPGSGIGQTTLPNPQQVQLPIVPGQGQTPPPGVAAPGAAPTPTQLQNPQEQAFRQWIAENKMPFDANAQGQNYDMRGFWQGLQQGNPHALGAMGDNPPFSFPGQWALPGHPNFQAPNLNPQANMTNLAANAVPTPTPQSRA